MQYVDPFAITVQEDNRKEKARLLRIVATLNKEIDRLEDRIANLYASQSRLPFQGLDYEAECYWEDVYNTYEYKIERLTKRVDNMYFSVWKFEQDLWWKFNVNPGTIAL